ncbi:26S protease regulatory subunit [Planktothrix sp. FACHB-1355]|uniref:26S protease regulatory subunit n=1 Tax=Aerosakkonema funiforme FACHB-1375 TaxID=2949571 RepID=A0A926ZL65_9CYAN|nr:MULTISPECIES: AAA family ATPase [Oscillatoriales]MBD2184761.1 26S protease regulatory subunit [Aerosakkonema funiforme FACHB-1375]MBD3559070.1 26S protease regulatory subunit [Planktothrix sp. FACHB-1355]
MKFEIVKDKKDPSTKDEPSSLLETPQWTLGEIALSKSTFEQIEEMIAYVKNREKLLYEWEFNRFLKTGNGLSINFFGPPGTGKSITAEAIAQKLGTNIIKVNYGELESELVGGTSKNLSKVFKLAEENKSLLFFDEADAVLSKRISNLSQAADHGVNSAKSTLLTLMDKFNGVIIFATNLFENYDAAFLRRIIFNVEFPVPDREMRIQLWEFHLSKNVPRNISYERAAEISEGLCGGDIRNITIKLGLKLLVGKTKAIDETVINEEINKYKTIKLRHQKINLAEAVVIEEENTSDLKEE